MSRLPLILIAVIPVISLADVRVVITTDEWWKTSSPAVARPSLVADPVMHEGYGAAVNESEYYFWSDNGVTGWWWEYKGPACITDTSASSMYYFVVDFLERMPSPVKMTTRDPGKPSTGGYGYIMECGQPRNRMFLKTTVNPIPPKPPAPLACRLDASTSIDIVAPPGHTRLPVAATIVCTGKGQASAVVRTTSPRSVVVADGVTVVLNGQLDESTRVTGGKSFPIDLHVDVENNHGVPGGYSASYVLTVDLT
ncbi:hypothetical protein [Serratia liquefaciens]|uniref:hypothetical protein n=1 Tax=Serratia liquefaciens TaxID=614 RepID=UPI00165D212C|nr:hypothetical protein [Serratia liquefaciens]QNQ55660.1 hypothetical protein IAI46_06715 [Serratia liquefaciens]